MVNVLINNYLLWIFINHIIFLLKKYLTLTPPNKYV